MLFIRSRSALNHLPSAIVGVLAKTLDISSTESFTVVTIPLPVMAGVVRIETPAIASIFLSPSKPVAEPLLLFPVVISPIVPATIPPIVPAIILPIVPTASSPIVPAVPAIISAVPVPVPTPSPPLRLNCRQIRKARGNHEAYSESERISVLFNFLNAHCSFHLKYLSECVSATESGLLSPIGNCILRAKRNRALEMGVNHSF